MGAKSLSQHLIVCLQRKYEKIMKEQDVLRSSIQQRKELTCQFQRHKVKLRQSLQEDQEHYRQRLEADKVWTTCPSCFKTSSSPSSA